MTEEPSGWRGFLKIIGNVRVGVVLMILIAAAAAAGTIVIQDPLGHYGAALRDYYGETTFGRLRAFYLMDVYHAPWFHAFLALLAVNLIASTVLHFSLKSSALPRLAAHVGMLTVLAGGLVTMTLGDRGVMELQHGAPQRWYYSTASRDNRMRELDFSVTLDRFEIDRHNPPQLLVADNAEVRLVVTPSEGDNIALPWTDATLIIERVIPNAKPVYDFDGADAMFGHPQPIGFAAADEKTDLAAMIVWLQRENAGGRFWLTTESPVADLGDALLDYRQSPHVSEFRAFVTLAAADEENRETVIRVNHPATFRGTQLLLSDYEGGVTLRVTRDPGLAVVYVGLVLLTAGIIAACLVKPWMKRKPKV